MSVQNSTSQTGETLVREHAEASGVYASLFEKINLTPVAALGDIDTWQDSQALADATADERVTAAVQVLLQRLKKSGQQVEKLDKSLLDHHIAELDYQISRQLDEVMHHQEFQKVESQWRGLKHLIDRTDFRQNVKIEILDISKDDLRQDFEDAPEITQSGLYGHTYIAEYDTPGGEPIGAVISSYEFDASPQDIALLRNISKVAAAAHMPFTAAVLPASSLNAVSQPSSEPFDALVYVIESEPAGQSVIHHSPASVTARPWKGFAAGMLTMFLICGAGGWGWQQLNPTISGPVPVEPTESALTELKLLSPLWRQHYGFTLAARAKPDDSARLKAQWQDYIVGNALAPQSLTGWHQGMEGLQTLMQRLNALDERKGKYLTGSELKSMVFTIMQDFGRTVPVEEQLYLLSQEKNGAPLPAALLLQTDTHFNQLLNRYALIQQPSETP